MLSSLLKEGFLMFGQKLKELRSSRNQTQQRLADYLGISRAAYSHFENSRNDPDRETIVKLADYFDVSTDYLLGRGNREYENPESKSQTVAAHIDEDVSEEEMEDILNYIEFIKQKHKKE